LNHAGEPINIPVIPEVEPRLAGRGETVRELRQGMGVRQIPDILDCVSDSGSCWKHASGMTGENFCCLVSLCLSCNVAAKA
jgi:hypothetical protein